MQVVSTDAPVEIVSMGGYELPESFADLLDYAYSAGHAQIVFELRPNLVRTIFDFFGGKGRRTWEHKAPGENAVNEVLAELFGPNRTELSHEQLSQGRHFWVMGKSRRYRVNCYSSPAIPSGASVIVRIVSVEEGEGNKMAIQ